MDNKAFRESAHRFADWMADYIEQAEQYPVKAKTAPGEIYSQLPDDVPVAGEDMEKIFRDFENIILPGMTHWQSPNFFAYFPANSSYPSVLAEMLTATLGAQCMKWETSPAAAELEEKMMEWLKKICGIPMDFQGVIQDSASTATLVAILCAREKFSGFTINTEGMQGAGDFRIYCSTETHSSIEKAVRIAGLGSRNLVKVGVDEQFRLDPAQLQQAIEDDLASGKKPICVVATLGTTGVTAIDPLPSIGELCARYGIWLHVDAAYAGSALILPEYRWMAEGLEMADSFVFNPHKWLFTNFDCSAYFVRDKGTLLRTLQIVPEYLRTGDAGRVNDYCDWSVPLGRRFRALKLWFVLRSFGLSGLQEKLRGHLRMAGDLAEIIRKEKDFEIMAPVTLNLVCFRYKPEGVEDEGELNLINEKLLRLINATGEAYMTHTKINGKYAIRMVVAQTNVMMEHVIKAWGLVQRSSASWQIKVQG
ncbi:MAG: aminotransferase class V-fold PLP-dependent enzyme [Bacteroidales bacterium]|jgi:aromatic-L-amino-acid decarboxylase|nr:aminotransferase class V-fold PLP-dependent enzyme [Bacteroidales bacterium]